MIMLAFLSMLAPWTVEGAQPRPTSPGLARPSPTSPCRFGWVWLGVAGCSWVRRGVLAKHGCVCESAVFSRERSPSCQQCNPNYCQYCWRCRREGGHSSAAKRAKEHQGKPNTSSFRPLVFTKFLFDAYHVQGNI